MGPMKTKKALFGAGCFWGVEAAFRKINGVVDTRVGYAGGDVPRPSYERVCTGTTGHAEVVEVTYNPEVISYPDLLEAFWNMHNPTEVNRQGPDVGDQYRSVIFYYTPEQKQEAEESQRALEESGKYSRPIATVIQPAPEFYEAEEYHQRYFEKSGRTVCPS